MIYHYLTHFSCCRLVKAWGLQSAVSLPLHAEKISIYMLNHSKDGVFKGWVRKTLQQGNGCHYHLWLRDREEMSFTIYTHLRGTRLLSTFIKFPRILLSFPLCKKPLLLVGLKEHYLLYITFLQLKGILHVFSNIFSPRKWDAQMLVHILSCPVSRHDPAQHGLA